MIKDNSILKMLTMSIEDGALYRVVRRRAGHRRHGGDARRCSSTSGRRSRPCSASAWDAPPRRSRLVHGVGIIALGCLMDEITYKLDEPIPRAVDFEGELQLIVDDCAWTEGEWVFAADDRRRWNELQNTPRDIKTLSDHLVTAYRRRSDPSGIGA